VFTPAINNRRDPAPEYNSKKTKPEEKKDFLGLVNMVNSGVGVSEEPNKISGGWLN